MNELVLYFQQNESSLKSYIKHLTELRVAIDEQDYGQIARHLEMLLGIYHLLEGNSMNIKNLVLNDHPELSKFFDEG